MISGSRLVHRALAGLILLLGLFVALTYTVATPLTTSCHIGQHCSRPSTVGVVGLVAGLLLIVVLAIVAARRVARGG